MLDLDALKAEFARSIVENQGRKWGLDSALLHVCTLAYRQGAADAVSNPTPADSLGGEVTQAPTSERRGEVKTSLVSGSFLRTGGPKP